MKSLVILVLALAWIAVPVAVGAHWDLNTDAKWVQMPDLTPMGIDINASPFSPDGIEQRYVLADDWLCTSTERIVAIHLWGSWLNDVLPLNEPENVMFTLSIHADIPAEQNADGYSMPGEVLWFQVFQPGSFTVRPWEEGIMEGWMDPPEGYQPPPADTICWQYNFPIDAATAFEQVGSTDNPIVYWLDVKAEPIDPTAYFGWKTAETHWNDAAVWGNGLEPYPGPWRDLQYPSNHEYFGQPIDLAFVLEGDGPQQTELDWGDAPDANYRTLAASNGPRHRISGLYLGNLVDAEPDGQPSPHATGDDTNNLPDEDGITFLDPVRAGATVQVKVQASAAGMLDAWIDFNLSGHFTGPDRIFNAQPVIAGVNTLTFFVPAWAKTNTLTMSRWRISPTGGLPPYGPSVLPPPDGEVEDWEVSLGDRWAFKWIQPPDLSPAGIDVEACEGNDPPGYILADDFECTRNGPITDINIWGSWRNDYLPFNEDPRAVDFTLSFHADIPAEQSPTGYSMPGELLREFHFPAGAFEVEREAVDIEEGWMTPPDTYFFPADWTCWLYKFHIPEAEVFWQDGSPGQPIVYWLDLQAKVHDPEAYFGWKTSREHWNDDAVWGLGYEPYVGPWRELIYPPQHELAGLSIDLAFALFENPLVDVDEETPNRTGLLNNAPNPFNPRTEIHFVMPPEGGHAKIEIFDTRGHRVTTLLDGFAEGGEQSVIWDGRNAAGREMPSGVYFYQLSTAAKEESLKMLLLR